MLILKQVYVVRLMYKASTWTKRRQIGVFVGRRRLVTDDNVFFLKEEKRERVLLSSLKALEKCVCGQRMAFRCKAKWWKIPNEKIHTGRRIGKKGTHFQARPHPDSFFLSCVWCLGWYTIKFLDGTAR